MTAFRNVSSAREDRERIIVNAQRYLASLTPRAHGNADYEVEQAKGEAYRRVAAAGAEAIAIETVAAAVRSAPPSRPKLFALRISPPYAGSAAPPVSCWADSSALSC